MITLSVDTYSLMIAGTTAIGMLLGAIITLLALRSTLKKKGFM